VDPLLEFDNLKDIVDDCLRNVDFLNNKSRKTFVVFLTMNSLSKDLDVYSFIDWKSVISSLLCMKITFKGIAFIYDQKSFNNLVVTLHEKDFKDDISMVYKILPSFQARSFSCEVIRFVDELAAFDSHLPLSFTGRKVYACKIFGVKASSSVVPTCDCPFLKK
jgi:hypothetical protein